MHETEEDLTALQALLDRSYAGAGLHLLDIHTPPRRLPAGGVAERLQGMCLLVLATVTGDGRPLTGPVDGIFYRGALYFSSSPQSVRLRHIARRPQVSATHLPAEEFAVVVHGRAERIDLSAPDQEGFRSCLLDVYLPRYGAEWEAWLAREVGYYYRIDAERMFAFLMDEPNPTIGLDAG
ncbi:MAG: pyridoxamine 5'-phosphate oxidase family protein [Actinomycetota bacterium]